MIVTELIRGVFGELDFESDGNCSDFTLERRFDLLRMRIIERECDFMVLEVLRKSNRIYDIQRTNCFETMGELELHLRNIRKEYPSFVFHPRF